MEGSSIPPEPPPPPPVEPLPPATVGAPTNDEKTLGLVCHLLGFVGLTTFLGIPFGNIIAPLILWLVKKNESAYINELGKEVLNFQITYAIFGVVAGILMLVLIGLLLAPVVAIAWIVLMIVGAIKASEGKIYRFPYIIRLIK